MGDALERDEAYSDELATLLDDRAATYALLARLLASEVDADLLSGLVGMAFPEDAGNPAIDEGSRLMNGYLRQAASRQGDDVVTELAVDFCRLFVVRRRNEKDAAYPFESVYTSTEHTTMAGARDDVRTIYRAAGFEKDENLHIGDDHIALELEYMAEVARQTAEAARGSEALGGQLAGGRLALQAAFLDNHLLNWVPRFSDAMVRHAQTDFYRGLARFLNGYLEDDRALLGELAAGKTA